MIAEPTLSLNQHRCAAHDGALVVVSKSYHVRRGRWDYTREVFTLSPQDLHVSAPEVEEAIERINSRKTLGPVDIASELLLCRLSTTQLPISQFPIKTYLIYSICRLNSSNFIRAEFNLIIVVIEITWCITMRGIRLRWSCFWKVSPTPKHLLNLTLKRLIKIGEVLLPNFAYVPPCDSVIETIPVPLRRSRPYSWRCYGCKLRQEKCKRETA